MESQENIDKDFTKARNYRIIREFRLKTQDDIVKILSERMPKVEGIKQNVSLWENKKGNPGKKYLDQLSDILTVPVHLFSMKGLTKNYLETMENSTDGHKPNDNKENPEFRENVYRTIVEGHTEYLLIPRSIMENTQLISTKQLEKDKAYMEALIEFNRDLLTKIPNVPKVQKG